MYFFKKKFALFQSILDLQCYISFRCIAKLFSYTHTHISILFRFFSYIGYYKILNIVPCVTQCYAQSLSHVWLFATLWTVARQAPQSIAFFRQEYWSGLPFPSPGDLPNPGIKPGLPHCRQTLYCLSHLVMSNSFLLFWTVACQTPLSMGFFRQEYWSGLSFLSPGDLLDSGIKSASLVSPTLQADSLPTEPSGKPGFVHLGPRAMLY